MIGRRRERRSGVKQLSGFRSSTKRENREVLLIGAPFCEVASFFSLGYVGSPKRTLAVKRPPLFETLTDCQRPTWSGGNVSFIYQDKDFRTLLSAGQGMR